MTHLCVRRWETDRTDELVKLHPLTQPQQGDVVVVVVGLEVRVEEDLVHGAVGGPTFVSGVVETKEDLKDRMSRSLTADKHPSHGSADPETRS